MLRDHVLAMVHLHGSDTACIYVAELGLEAFVFPQFPNFPVIETVMFYNSTNRVYHRPVMR